MKLKKAKPCIYPKHVAKDYNREIAWKKLGPRYKDIILRLQNQQKEELEALQEDCEE